MQNTSSRLMEKQVSSKDLVQGSVLAPSALSCTAKLCRDVRNKAHLRRASILLDVSVHTDSRARVRCLRCQSPWGPLHHFTLEVLGGQQKAVEGSLQHVVNETTKEMIARSCATIVTHPFHVITLRCMVQFIGRETKYSGVFDSIITVYREEGILGFFAGLIPRLLGDVLSLWICNLLAHLINTYAIDDSMSHTGEIKNCSQAVTGFFASMLTYPFVLVSNLMAVNNCGLAGGLPPYASVYPTWVDCWRHLSREGNMSRGNSLFFRKLPAGKMYAIDQKRFF
uniref:Mitochondrial carrier homolog 2 n=1 Tax=Lates calcarifer TaxID=8187 RepID=A0A4W6EN28_LATCA